MNDACGFEPTQYTSAPQQTEGWVDFRQPAEKVFARVVDHAAMGEWLPFIKDITVTHPHVAPPGESTIGTARHITVKGGLAIIETVVYWNPPVCYAYTGQGKHFPLKNYVGLLAIEPAKAQGGRLVFREYFDELGRVEQASLPHGVVALFKQGLGNLAQLIGGTAYAMTTVSRV